MPEISDEAVEAAAKAISYPQTWVAMSLTDQRLAEDKARAALEAAAPSLLTALLGELEEKRAECEMLEVENQRLHMALATYGSHHQSCQMRHLGEPLVCDCGFAESLVGTEGKP